MLTTLQILGLLALGTALGVGLTFAVAKLWAGYVADGKDLKTIHVATVRHGLCRRPVAAGETEAAARTLAEHSMVDFRYAGYDPETLAFDRIYLAPRGYDLPDAKGRYA